MAIGPGDRILGRLYVCTWPDCWMPRTSALWCEAHRRQQIRGESMRTARVNRPDKCHVRGCRQASTLIPGWCDDHAARCRELYVRIRELKEMCAA